MNRRRATGSIPFGLVLLLIPPVGICYLIWLICQRVADSAEQASLMAGWDAAIAQMAAAERAGEDEEAARWEAKADAIYLEMTGKQPEDAAA